MAEIIDLTVSPQRPEVIEVSSDEDTPPGHGGRIQENKKRKRKKTKVTNGLASSAQPSRAHSLEIGNENESTPRPRSVSPPLRISSSTGEPGLFFFDGAAAPVIVKDSSPTPEHTESNGNANQLLLPSHVAIFRDDAPIPAEVFPPPKLSSDDEGYIEYLDYEDRKVGLVRYFEVAGEESNQLGPSIFKCKNCGAEGDHKTYECPIQICLTCGARDEHSTRSCPIGKTCYTCGMKGHINKTCPNRFSTFMASSELHRECDRCGSTEHKTNECPTLWRIYQYVNDEERVVIMQSREEKEQLAIGQGGEAHIGSEVWCYNCANTGHLGDDCDEVPHLATCPAEHSAFSSHNVMSGPFYDPTTELVFTKLGPRERDSRVDWNASVPVDVGKRGKNKDRERLEKRFREQEDEDVNWFNDIRNARRKGPKGKDYQEPLSGPRGKTLKFGSFKDGANIPSSPLLSLPTGHGDSSLLSRLSDKRGGKSRSQGDRNRDRHEPSRQLDGSIRIRGAATDQRTQDALQWSTKEPSSGNIMHSLLMERERGQARWDEGKPGHRGAKGGHGPRYRGGYDR